VDKDILTREELNKLLAPGGILKLVNPTSLEIYEEK
jgi:hypothetical protein